MIRDIYIYIFLYHISAHSLRLCGKTFFLIFDGSQFSLWEYLFLIFQKIFTCNYCWWNECRKILLAHDTSWVYVRWQEWERWENEKYESFNRKNNLSIDPVWRCKLNPLERDVNSRVNSFISREELEVYVWPVQK